MYKASIKTLQYSATMINYNLFFFLQDSMPIVVLFRASASSVPVPAIKENIWYASGFLNEVDQVCYCARTYCLNDKDEIN